ncbi:hypothetical protein GIB67_001931 [Kingdonia uniflora]|uniref:NUC153 domain-containing protein n=1 Tax=Kingdonia uniflora TaxID=39325 RepID=A0A7J7NVL6_9MAGN|nr:hypothetical protein GIB67_001931 [Kingdonia uniflora]
MAQQGGSIKSTSINGVKWYHITGDRSTAPLLNLNPKKRRALRRNKDYMQRVELLQDLRFQTSTSRIKITPDGEFVVASGNYPPQVKVFELRELAMKFERNLTSEVVDFQILSDDYSKIAFLCDDRSIRLHAKYGSFYLKTKEGKYQNQYNLRIPSIILNPSPSPPPHSQYYTEIIPNIRFKLIRFKDLQEITETLYVLLPSHPVVTALDVHYGHRAGRDTAYDPWSCDLLCAASSPDLYRINLHEGRFLSSFVTQSPALNVVSRSKVHGLIGCGGEDGAVQCFDSRMKTSVGRIDAVGHAGDNDQEVTALEFDDKGLQMAVGSSSGKVLIYDLRSSHPIQVKDHMYGSHILNIKWHQTLNYEQPKLITTDEHVVKIWDPETGENMTSIEPTGGRIKDMCVFRDSGLMLLALDSSQIPSYFVPALGTAPKWCSYLENLTEELEESAETVIYEDLKFVTKEELQRLGMEHMIGSNLLHASMHGFFIDRRLYKKVYSYANPFAYDEYVEQQNKEKLERERASRITRVIKLPKVNRTLAAKIRDDEESQDGGKDADANGKRKPNKKRGLCSDVLEDKRFAAMFENKNFEINESSQEYKLLHPMSSKKHPSLIEEHFEPVREEDEDDQSLSDDDVSAKLKDDLIKDKSTAKKKLRNPSGDGNSGESSLSGVVDDEVEGSDGGSSKGRGRGFPQAQVERSDSDGEMTHLYNSFTGLTVDVESVDKFANLREVEGYDDSQGRRRMSPNPNNDPAQGDRLEALPEERGQKRIRGDSGMLRNGQRMTGISRQGACTDGTGQGMQGLGHGMPRQGLGSDNVGARHDRYGSAHANAWVFCRVSRLVDRGFRLKIGNGMMLSRGNMGDMYGFHDRRSRNNTPNNFGTCSRTDNYRPNQGIRATRLYEVKDERHADAFHKNVSLANEDAVPLGERVAALQNRSTRDIPGDIKMGAGGSREISFISRNSARYREDREEEREAKRRGIQSLGLKPDSSSGFRGRGRGGRGRGRGGGRGRGRGGRGNSRGRGRG